MREAAGGPLIAEHRDHEWHVDGERFSRLDVDGPVNVHFIDHSSSKAHGPFSSFSAVNGVAFRERSVFAFVEQGGGTWYCQEEGRRWPCMIVEPA